MRNIITERKRVYSCRQKLNLHLKVFIEVQVVLCFNLIKTHH